MLACSLLRTVRNNPVLLLPGTLSTPCWLLEAWWQLGNGVTASGKCSCSSGRICLGIWCCHEESSAASDGFSGSCSVFTCGRVPKSLMALKRRFCRCVPKSLMGSPDAGSVVTWRGAPLSLMDLRGESSVQGSGETSVLCCFCFSFVSLALV